MPKKILVAYSSNAGSTTEVAQAIGETLGQEGVQVDVQLFHKVGDVGAYNAVVVGGPMIVGWHGKCVKFVAEHQQALSQIPVAYFFTALNLTKTDAASLDGIAIYQDPSLAKAPKDENKLSFKEKHSTPARFLKAPLEKAPLVKPVSAAFFAGVLDYGKLNILHKLFVKLIIRASVGDFRDWDVIRDWAANLSPALLKE